MILIIKMVKSVKPVDINTSVQVCELLKYDCYYGLTFIAYVAPR